jgi:hypothetical protein
VDKGEEREDEMYYLSDRMQGLWIQSWQSIHLTHLFLAW